MNVTKAIIPVAGWGTRMLPITKAIEKCMLPVGTRPVIDYVVQDAIQAGISEIYFVVNEQSTQLKSYYSDNHALNEYLERKGRSELLAAVTPPHHVTFHYITQPSDGRYGTSVPVGLLNDVIADDEQALVIMGDQFLYRTDGGSSAADLMTQVSESSSAAGLYGVPVPDEEVSKYGIIEMDDMNHFVQIVEKPPVEAAPSNLNNASFYLFPKRVFELAASLPANPARGEYEITDAINAYVAEGSSVIVSQAAGEYLDAGSPQGWVYANTVVTGAPSRIA